MCEVALRVNSAFDEFENMIASERQRAADIREERDQLANLLDNNLKFSSQNPNVNYGQNLETALRV